MASKIRNLLTLIRVRQYYKNGLIFFGLFFSKNLLNSTYYIPFILGFIVLCCTSSVNYIINDLKDIEDDKKHSEKIHKKPLASGEISKSFAFFILVVLSGIILFSLIFLISNIPFAIMVIMLVITGQLYNHVFKNYAFIDITVLSFGYLWRALAGSLLIDIQLSPWLFIAIFEIAMFLSTAKRKGDLMILGEKENAISHKRVYNTYNQEILNQIYVMIGASLFMTYSLYLIFHFNLDDTSKLYNFHEYVAIFSIPVFLYIIMRYMYLTTTKPEIARSPEKAIFDKGMIIAGAVLVGILAYSYYFDIVIAFLLSLF